MTPVDELIVIGEGSVPDVRAKLYGAVPPFTVTGVIEHAELIAHEPVGTACVDPSELSVKDFDEDGLTPSFTVTVNVVWPSADDGAEPLIAPVDVLNERPDGSVPPLNA